MNYYCLKAREANVDLIEFDLSLTKDKIAILMHDDSLQRTCGEPMLISSLLLAEIIEKDAAKTFTFQGYAIIFHFLMHNSFNMFVFFFKANG